MVLPKTSPALKKPDKQYFAQSGTAQEYSDWQNSNVAQFYIFLPSKNGLD